MRPNAVLRLIFILLAFTGMLKANLTSHPTDNRTPVEVRIQMILIDLEKISGADQNFTANLGYGARWTDPRLRNSSPAGKTVELKDIWHPNLQIINQQRLQATFPNEAHVSPEGEVTLIQRVWGQFSQPLSLKDFPFDEQSMRTSLLGVGHQPGSVVFVADRENPSSVADKLAISDWSVIDWFVEPTEASITSTSRVIPIFKFSLQVRRNFSYHLVNLVLPLVLIICMSWVVFWINPKNANPRISVSVTAMLTLIAYRFAISASLPKIGYLTKMDWFILGSSVLVFTSLLEVVITSWLDENNRSEAASRINKWMRVIAPIAFILITILSLS